MQYWVGCNLLCVPLDGTAADILDIELHTYLLLGFILIDILGENQFIWNFSLDEVKWLAR